MVLCVRKRGDSMKKITIKILFISIFLIIFGFFQANKSEASTTINSLEKKNGVYIVPYGKEIVMDGASLTSENPNIATIINKNTIRVNGVGNFSIQKEIS